MLECPPSRNIQDLCHWRLLGLLCCALWWPGNLLFGQDLNQLTYFSTADGLPGNHVVELESDAEGFSWVSTRNGLARYDGRRFVPFSTLRPGTVLPREGLSFMLIDGHNFLWISAKNTLYRVSLATFEVAFYDKPLMPACKDAEGNAWFTSAEGLVQYRVAHDDFQTFPLLVKGEKTAVVKLNKGRDNYLLAKSRAAYFRFDVARKVYEPLHALGDLVPTMLIVASDAEGMLWLSAWYHKTSGFIHYDPYKDRILQAFNCTDHGISSTDLNSIWSDGTQVWMGTNSGGLCRYSISEHRFYCYPIDEKNPKGLWMSQLTHVSKDVYGNLWIGTTFGLYLARANRQTTELLAPTPYTANSLVARPITCLQFVSDTLLAAGSLKGLSLYDPGKKIFLNLHLPLYNNNPYNDQMRAFARAEPGTFWAATWSGLFRLNNRTGRILEYYITHFNAGPNHSENLKKLEVGAVSHLHGDRDGTLWVTNFGGLLTKITGAPGGRMFEHLHTLVKDDDPLNDQVLCLLDYDARYLLLGTAAGLLRYDRNSRVFETLPLVFPGLDKVPAISALTRSRKGDLLLVAEGKPFRMGWKNGQADVKPIVSQLALLNCQYVVEDETGTVWITQEEGIVQIDERQGVGRLYDSRNYLHDNLFAMKPPLLPVTDRYGNFYLGGTRGITVLNPAHFAPQQSALPVVKITGLKVNGEIFVSDSAVSLMQTLQLSWQQANLGFEFSVLNAAVPELSRYSYRLNNGRPVDLGFQNTVNFSNLAPGTYNLQVKAANSEGVWSEKEASLLIVIRPPWWRSIWAYLGYALLIGFAIYYRYRFQLRQKIAQQEARQLREMDAFKSRFFTNITHEFRTPLTVILGMTTDPVQHPKDRGPMEGEVLEKRLPLIRRNAENLLSLINQLLDLAKLESNALQLNYIQGDVLAYLRYLTESLHSYAQVRNIQLIVKNEDLQAFVMDYDPERLLQIVHNLLSNAIKFTPTGGQVTLFVEQEATTPGAPPMLLLKVTDTGTGISPESLPRIFDRFFQAGQQGNAHTGAGGVGIGLALTQELVHLMGGRIAVESALGHGTTFTVRLPITRHATSAEVIPQKTQTPKLETPKLETQNSKLETQSPKLLLIEDNPDVVEYLRMCLSGPYEVEVAYNGRTGIEKALELVPDLIVSDVMMPEKDGFEVVEALKNDKRTSHIPIVLLTARATMEDRIAGLRRGADAYLAKPFHREEFLVTVENLLQSRRVLQQRLREGLFEPKTLPVTDAAEPSLPVSILEMEDEFVQKMRRYVESQLDNADLSMDDLSRAMTMSYPNLHRKVTALTNLTPVHFIRLIRLQKAKTLLQTTALSIGDIAFETGFSDHKYFGRVFAEEYGMTPSAMRRVAKGES